MKHTKGNWESLYTIVIGPDSETIAECPDVEGVTRETRKANARLIAAAPRMLQLLENIASTAPLRGLPRGFELDIQAACDFLTNIREADKKDGG